MHQGALFEKKQEALMNAAVNVTKVVNAKVPPNYRVGSEEQTPIRGRKSPG